MPNPNVPNRRAVTSTEISAAYREYREDELLDAVATAAAVIARADGWVQAIEREQFVDFLDRKNFMSVFPREEILDAFERSTRKLREPRGLTAAVERLKRHGEGSAARLLLDLCEEIAAADCRLDPREERILEIIRATLRVHSSPSAPRSDPPGATTIGGRTIRKAR